MLQDTTQDTHQASENETWCDDQTRSLVLELLIEDPELISILSRKRDGRERDQFASDALKIGLLAIENAHSRVDSEKIRNEGERLMENFGTALQTHRKELTREITGSLADYFAPNSGRLSQRVEQLVKKDGDLEKVIRAQIDGDGSMLVNTLRTHIGSESPLLKYLDPQSKSGLASNLAQTVGNIAEQQREEILKEFSLDNQNGALSRTLRELSEAHGEAGETLEKKISTAMKEFSLDNENGALSRLVARVDQAQRTLSDEFSLDKDDSALARMRKEFSEQIAALSTLQKDFESNVMKQLGEMTARKEESYKSTTHGIAFETALFEQVQRLTQAKGDIAEQTGASTGRIKNSKVGDIVITLGPDHHFADTKIVIEAKQNKSVTLAKAREEIEIARQNRNAEIGIFVYSAKSAANGLARLSRYGRDIFIVWDEDDAATDLILETALSLASAMIMHGGNDGSEHSADFDKIERALLNVQKQITNLDDYDKFSNTIITSGEKIREKTRKMRDALHRDIKILNDTVSGVKNSLQ